MASIGALIFCGVAVLGTVYGWSLEHRHGKVLHVVYGACVGIGCGILCFQEGMGFEFIPLLFCISACSTADIIAFEIPNEPVLLGAISGVVVRYIEGKIGIALLWGLLGIAIGIVLVLIGDLLGKNAFGMGDAKAMGMLGLWLGPQWPAMFVAAALCGALYGLLLILKNGLEARKQMIPFFPFLGLSSILALTGIVSLATRWWMDTVVYSLVSRTP